MSCGFPLPPTLVAYVPKVVLPSAPSLPIKPDFAWATDLGISIVVPDIIPGVPKVSLPSLPTLPLKPDFGWSADLGIDVEVPDIVPGVPKVSLPSPPSIPDPLPSLACPFDEAA